MAEFCTCGSIIIGGSCTNKNCANKTAAPKSTTKKTVSSVKKEPKTAKTKRSSKVVTYNLYDIKEPEENI